MRYDILEEPLADDIAAVEAGGNGLLQFGPNYSGLL
jgi:hypothetical protein